MHLKSYFKTILLILVLVNIPYLSAQETGNSVKIGDTISAFNANDQDGKLWKSSDHIGEKFLVVYFYPAAMTGGCTKQACSYRDYKSSLQSLNAEVVGVSGDAVENLKVFAAMHNLNFTLLSDVNGVIAQRFGVPTSAGKAIEREIDGRSTRFERSVTESRWTFILDQDGKLIYKDTEVNAAQDGEKVTQFLKSLEK